MYSSPREFSISIMKLHGALFLCYTNNDCEVLPKNVRFPQGVENLEMF